MMEDLAPIVLFVYNRPEHTKKTLEALHKNIYADDSILYIFADGPKENATEADLKKIEQTRTIIKEKKWCKEVILVMREKNIQLNDNIIEGVTRVINKYGKIITLEDDLVTSPYFLKYCNDGLKMYKDHKQVFAINAYMYPVDFGDEPGTFLCPFPTHSWGWASWADRWEHYEYAPKYANEIENNILLKNRFNFGNLTLFQMLKHINTWDMRWYYTGFVRNGLGLFPTKSLVQNIGFDGSGTHTGFGVLKQQLHDSAIPVVYQSNINLSHYSKFINHFKLYKESLLQKVKNSVKKLINYNNYNAWWNEPGQKLY